MLINDAHTGFEFLCLPKGGLQQLLRHAAQFYRPCVLMHPIPIEISSQVQPSIEMAAVDNAKKMHNALKWPLIAYSLLGGFYMSTVGKNAGTWTWFNWHPLFMLIGFVALAGNAALIKKIGGYENTKAHGIMMWGAVAAASFAWYVIYTNKEMLGKAHLMTIHGKLGFAVMLSYFGLGLAGGVALHPDFGIMKTNKTIRFAHKWGGRVVTMLAWTCCVLGKLNHLLTGMLFIV